MARIVVLSDIHLSPTHGFFWENWCVAREFADAAKADAVIVNGDLAINGPDSDAEIAFAAGAQGNLHTRVMALPGNHDVGDEPPGGRCGIAVLDFSQDSVEVTIERPRRLISHDLAAIKGHGRYQFLRDMPPFPPPHAR